MNPLSPLIYYRRHKHSALLLVALIVLVTLGISIMIGVLDSVLENSFTASNYVTRFSRVYPVIGSSLEPTAVSQIRAHPDVERVIPENGMLISLPSLFGEISFNMLGVAGADIRALMDVCDVRLKEGRLLEAHTNEILLPEEVARALELEIGDKIDRSINKNYYENIMEPLVLVGILESDPSAGVRQGIRLGFVSYEYLDSHELYAPRPSGLLVVAREGRKITVDDFLETTILSSHTDVLTHGLLKAFSDRAHRTFYLIFGIVECLVVVVIALVVGTINQISLSQRLAELGLLHAIGYHKNRLVHRLTLETATMSGVGWIAGLTLSRLIFAWLKVSLYEPMGMELNLANLAPAWFTIPIPLMAIISAAVSIVRVLGRVDAVAIIERGKLSMEARGHERKPKRSRTPRSSARPLSGRTFYLRHRRQGLLLVVSIALMILGVAFPAFLVSPILDAQLPLVEYLRHVSVVSPGVERAIDPAVTVQIRAHPAAEHVISAIRLNLWISILSTDAAFLFYGVPENDLPALIDLYGGRLTEGRLPRPRSNEIVLSEAAAMNRGLHVGDTIGRPIFERDDSIPTEMVVVGLLGPGDKWLGFASFEYLESHELYSSWPISLLIVPVEGRETELNEWLEKDVASDQTNVRTYDTEYREIQQAKRGILLVCAALESIIAVVTTIALAILNYIFFTQRREEFGTLYALGHSRSWLVLRTVRETVSVVGLAWLIGSIVCVTGLIFAQVNIFAPKGMSIDFSNVAPWLFTIPIPLTVVAVSVGVVAWMLHRLDPVSIIERR